LHAEPTIIRERFLQRGWEPQRVQEAVEEAIKLEHADFIDLRVDTSTHSVSEAARIVRAQAGNWPGLT
jgi:broad-specificity NMP kinase